MSKMIRLVAMVAANKVADVLELLGDVAETVTLERDGAVVADSDDDGDVETSTARTIRANMAVAAHRRIGPSQIREATRRTARLAGRVIYTPAGTQRQIGKMLDELRGVNTMRAFVLKDLAKHPGSTNREVRERIAPTAKKHSLSVESVDNIIWKMVGDGTLNKESEAAR